MTYHPNNAEPPRRVVRERSGIGGIVLPLIGAAIFIAIIVFLYSNNGDRRESLFNGPPETTGQGNIPRPSPMQPNPNYK